MSIAVMEGRAAPKTRLVARWAMFRLGRIEHEARVARLAVRLLDITENLHDLSLHHRRLLRLAALVHDVGRSKDDEDHPAVGARMIRQSVELPLKKSDRRALAYLTMFHRGSAPPLGQDGILKRRDDRPTLRLILGFLRAADALDCRWLAAPRITLHRRGRRLRVVVHLRDNSEKARRAFNRRKKFKLLEEMLDCRVELEIRHARELELAA
jgi:exopolyphosphatase/pppGpp-phosphohydrolase